MNKLTIKLNKLTVQKYTDCKLIIVSENTQNTQSYDVNKIILASNSKFFELLFDKELKSEYIINVSFSLITFDKFIKKLYNDHSADKHVNDINSYIEELLMCTYFQISAKKINKLLVKIINYLENKFYKQSDSTECSTFFKFINEHMILSINITNLQHRLNHIMEELYLENLNGEPINKSFIENYVDEKLKKIVITRREDERYIFSKNEYVGLRFHVYSTFSQEKHDNSYGFWISANPLNEKLFLSTDEVFNILRDTDQSETIYATIKLEILNGVDDLKTFKIGSFRDSKNKFAFPPKMSCLNRRDRYGKIIDGEIKIYPSTLYKFIIEFE